MALRRQAKKRRLMMELLAAQKMSEHLQSTALIYYAHSRDAQRARRYYLLHDSLIRLSSGAKIVYVFRLFTINRTMYCSSTKLEVPGP